MDIIIETVFHYGPDPELSLGKYFQDACCHQMRKRVALGIELFILRHTRILRVFGRNVAAYWKRESKTAMPTSVAMVPIKPMSSVNRIKLDLLFE